MAVAAAVTMAGTILYESFCLLTVRDIPNGTYDRIYAKLKVFDGWRVKEPDQESATALFYMDCRISDFGLFT